MSSSFGGLNVALTALQAQRRGLDVAGQNIANVNTDGYSRQRMNLQALGGSPIPAIFSVANGTGGGVAVTDVTRVQDVFLEAQARAEHAQNAYLAGQSQTYLRIEQAYGEPGDNGVQSSMDKLWNSFHDLTQNPGESATRAQVLDRAADVTTGLNRANDSLNTYWRTTRSQVDIAATDINTAADSIAQLNGALQRANAAGMPANELADQRDAQVRQLAELAGATAIAQSDGTVSITLGGSNLVNGGTARHVEATGATMLANVATSPTGLRWTDNQTPAVLAGGSIGSAVATLNTVLPDSVAKLDAVALSLSTTLNAQHQLGFDLAGNPGQPLISGTTAGTIAVAITDPSLVAASGLGTPGGDLDGSNADAMAGIATMTNGPDSSYRQLVADLAVASQAASRRSTIQSGVTADIDTARNSQSGVSLDEEMTNMMAYQRAYEAAARVLTTLDGALDTLINHTGRG